MHAVIYTDASIAGPPRPAPAGAGYVIIFEHDGVWETAPGARALGLLHTPQEAEYHAVLWALRAAVRGNFSNVVLRTDSKLLVNQMNGVSQVLDVKLLRLASKLRELCAQFEKVDFQWVRRRSASRARAL